MLPKYCKAARALLGWKQADLAHLSKVSLTAVKNFENATGQTRDKTILALRAALETAGIEFSSHGGLRLLDETIQSHRFSGKNCIQSHNEMIYATLRTSSGEILTCSPDDTLWTSPLAHKANIIFKDWRKKLNIRGKTIAVFDNSRLLNEPRHQYRFMAAEMIGTITYVIYADRISFILWKQQKVFVLQNALIVDTFRRQFEYLWRIGTPGRKTGTSGN